MPAAVVDLNENRIIEQNSRFSLVLLYPGDVARARFKGQIRKGYGQEVIADFLFTPANYDEMIGKTRIEAFLPSKTTEKILVPPNNGYYVYDVVMFEPGKDAIRLIQGKVYISPGVTDV